MEYSDPAEEFDRALARLEELRPSVAQQVDPDGVYAAVTDLQLAVTRAFGGRRPRAKSGGGARLRILRHLQNHVGEWVTGGELAVVSGIGEWARRVRELRLEQGYMIEEEAGSYRLVEVNPDVDAAARWQLLNDVRRSEGTAEERLLALLTQTVGAVVPLSELNYVAATSEARTIIREIRDEGGVPIDSAMDSGDLRADEFRLVSANAADRRDALQRLFPERVRGDVFHRDRFRCWSCHRDRTTAVRDGDAQFYLQVHHLHAEPDQLESLPLLELVDPASLATYCRSCLLEARAASRQKHRWEGAS